MLIKENYNGTDMLDLFATLTLNNLTEGKKHLFQKYKDNTDKSFLKLFNKKINEFSEIIFNMGNYSKEIENKYLAYCRLLEVNLPNAEPLSKRYISKRLNNSLISNIASNIKIKLTPAGEQFVFLISDMEMYYARHLTAWPSLFSTYARDELNKYDFEFGDKLRFAKMPHYIFLRAKEVIEASLLDDYLCFVYGFRGNEKFTGIEYGHSKVQSLNTISYNTAITREDGSLMFESLALKILRSHMNALNDFASHLDDKILFNPQYTDDEYFHATQAVQRALARYYVLYEDLSNERYKIFWCNANSDRINIFRKVGLNYIRRYNKLFVLRKQNPSAEYPDLSQVNFNAVYRVLEFDKIFNKRKIPKDKFNKLNDDYISEIRNKE
jgi:hypothetical protein